MTKKEIVEKYSKEINVILKKKDIDINELEDTILFIDQKIANLVYEQNGEKISYQDQEEIWKDINNNICAYIIYEHECKSTLSIINMIRNDKKGKKKK